MENAIKWKVVLKNAKESLIVIKPMIYLLSMKVMYCRAATAEQLLPEDRKKETLIAQKSKKALIS